MTVRGETFEDDVLKMAPAGAVRVQADADWGGDVDRRSTSGVIVWVKTEADKSYLVQSVSQKQTTIALPTAEAELISMLAGVCRMCGVNQTWRWILAAKGVIDDVKAVDEIIGSDSKAGINILTQSGSSRRTKHMKLKVLFLHIASRST